MAGHRAYVKELLATVGQPLALSRDESHHLLRVLRVREGESITLFDAQGKAASGSIATQGKEAIIQVQQIWEDPAPNFRMEVFAAVLKGKSMDSLLRAANECAATSITPLFTDHGEVHLDAREAAQKHEHWHTTLIESCKQCGNLRSATLLPARKFADLSLAFQTPTYVCSLETGSMPFLETLEQNSERLRQSRTLSLFIGPEGDFSPREYAHLRALGATPIRLGKNVLRAPTAAAYCLAVAEQFFTKLG